MSNSVIGHCALCGKETELTYEHIPPRKAFNWFSAKTLNGEDIFRVAETDRNPWDFSNIPYNNAQRGVGDYYLCMQCNNNTGTWYGNDYVKFVQGFHNILQRLQPTAGMKIHVEEAMFRPLPVIKQIVSMFCSLNCNASDNPEMTLLRNFVLEKESTKYPADIFRLGMYLVRAGLTRQIKFVVKLTPSPTGAIIEKISEIATYPLGFVLYWNADQSIKMPYIDITCFSEHMYDEECKVSGILPVYECNTMFPGDHRSKTEIEKCIEENRKYTDDFNE